MVHVWATLANIIHVNCRLYQSQQFFVTKKLLLFKCSASKCMLRFKEKWLQLKIWKQCQISKCLLDTFYNTSYCVDELKLIIMENYIVILLTTSYSFPKAAIWKDTDKSCMWVCVMTHASSPVHRCIVTSYCMVCECSRANTCTSVRTYETNRTIVTRCKQAMC